jgi:hypothetical protein
VKKSFDQFTFAANGQAGKFLEPLSAGNFRSGVQPAGQQAKLVGGNVPALDAVQ